MKRWVLLCVVMFMLLNFAANAMADDIWIDTSAEALRDAGNSVAVQMSIDDYSEDRRYIGVDAVIHFSANNKEYELYHVLDTMQGCFVLSTLGIELYPYSLFGGEEDAEASAYFDAEQAAKNAYFDFVNSQASGSDSSIDNNATIPQADLED